MSLQVILDRIRAAGIEKVTEIEKQAQNKADSILAEARLEASQIEENACTIMVEPSVLERARIVHRARQETLTLMGNVREELVNEALRQIQQRLCSMREDSRYGTMLSQMVAETILEFSSANNETGKIKLELDPRDKQLFKINPSLSNLEMEISYTLNCWGGVVAKSEDERVVVINTLESRFARALPYLRRALAAWFEVPIEES